MRAGTKLLVTCVLAVVFGAVAAAAPAELSGKFMANGKAASLSFVRIVPHDPIDGEAAYTIVICEKDPSKAETPEMDAMFKKLGDALIIGVTKSGMNFSNTLVHKALENSGLGTSGTVDVEGFKIDGGFLSARFFMKKEGELKPDRFSFDVKVRAPLPKGK